ncbi:hypothetical protein IE53DRAFT_368128 [Violaceomyces palustris]|uniref:Uncharacterized protein n=1 Tax=Violaceomyces palustris TaxID=1673888 RepID=A0ACD0NZW0_9BASI|nr:hypothetical protein IE53DRAFT_368128 [Violaceomyces palustris]
MSESSSSSSSSSSTSLPTSTQSTGPAGLGVISSLSPQCTPLKHRYDRCFNDWFGDYLSLGDARIAKQAKALSSSSASEDKKNLSSSASSSTSSSWFGGSSTRSTETSLGEEDQEDQHHHLKRKEVMTRYESECGALFKEYKECVRRAVTEKGLDPLIKQARLENPFPFDHERGKGGGENNHPFPFPAATKREG